MGRYEVYRGYVPRVVCKTAARRLWLELRRHGVSAEQVAEWSASTWWPHLRWEPEVLALQGFLDGWRQWTDEWADPQILVRLPDEDSEAEAVYTSHVDTLPDWAVEKGLKYAGIFGVELTSSAPRGGGIVVDGMRQQLRAGDVLRMNPDVPHSGSPNLSGNVRMAVYFRLLTPA